MLDDCTNVHTEFDLRKAEINIQRPKEYFISGC
jgi:hypothetical protein